MPILRVVPDRVSELERLAEALEFAAEIKCALPLK
jgi:hypothetical protein